MDQAPGLNRNSVSENKEGLKKRILLADDDPSFLVFMTDVLDMLGYEVVAVKNGKELLDKLIDSREKFDAVISDNNMPEMNGIEVLEHISEDLELKRLPFILQTSAGNSELENRAKELGGRCTEKSSSIKYIKNILEEELKEKDE